MALSIQWRLAKLTGSVEKDLVAIVDPIIVEAVVDLIRGNGTTLEELYREIPATREEINEILSGLYDSELIYTDYRAEPARIRWGWARTIYT